MMKVTLELSSEEYMHDIARALAVGQALCPSKIELCTCDSANNCSADTCYGCWMTALNSQRVTRSSIEKALFEAGLQPKLLGFLYIADAIECVIHCTDEVPGALNTYHLVAKKYGISFASVDQCIKYAVHKAGIKSKAWEFITTVAYALNNNVGSEVTKEEIYNADRG